MNHEASTPITEGHKQSVQTLGQLAKTMGISVSIIGNSDTSAIGDILASGAMPVNGNTQPIGLLHGGASAVLAETVGSVAAQSLAPEGMVAVGTELNISHHRPAHDGTVFASARIAHHGRRTCVLEIAINDQAGRRVASARLACAFISDPR